MSRMLFLITILLCFSSTIYSATSTTTFTVSADVVDDCSVSANNLTFADYDPTSESNDDSTTTVDVTCTVNTAYDIGLSAGMGSGATVTTRKLTDATNTLNYSLYSDSNHSTVWGNTVSTDTMSSTGTGSQQAFTVYGRIPGSQNTAVPGSYTDTITVTVTY